jgi:hypothetical protein
MFGQLTSNGPPKPAALAVVWGEGLKGRSGVGPLVSTQAKSPRQRIALELLRRTSSNLSEDFFECSGEPVARTLGAFRGLLTDVLALIRRLRAYSRSYHYKICRCNGLRDIFAATPNHTVCSQDTKDVSQVM